MNRPMDRGTATASLDERVAALAARQHGAVTRVQLLEAGLTPRMIERWLDARRLRRLHRGVYLLGAFRGPLEPEHARVMAAVLACGPAAVVSHRSAGWLWELLRRPASTAPVEITVPADVRVRRPKIRVIRSNDLSDGETTVRNGIPVTTPGRTLRDLSAVLDTRELSQAVARGERAGLLDAAELPRLVAHQRGRPGAPLLRAVVHGCHGPALTRSKAEDRFLDLVRDGRLPVPESNVVVVGHEVDFFWRAEKLVVEVDGFGFHASRRSFENDRRRDADLAAAGMRVIRVTWRQMADEPGATLVRVGQALARAGG